MPLGIRSGEIDSVEEKNDIAETVLTKLQVDEILTASWKVVLKEEDKHSSILRAMKAKYVKSYAVRLVELIGI